MHAVRYDLVPSVQVNPFARSHGNHVLIPLEQIPRLMTTAHLLQQFPVVRNVKHPSTQRVADQPMRIVEKAATKSFVHVDGPMPFETDRRTQIETRAAIRRVEDHQGQRLSVRFQIKDVLAIGARLRRSVLFDGTIGCRNSVLEDRRAFALRDQIER